jgi:hypothetical protein
VVDEVVVEREALVAVVVAREAKVVRGEDAEDMMKALRLKSVKLVCFCMEPRRRWCAGSQTS